MIFGFDIISDLSLSNEDIFDWTGSPTSLFCIIPGNISNDIKVVRKTLKHLSTVYQGVFYIDGSLETPNIHERDAIVAEIAKSCSTIPNVVYLHNNVVVVDGIALVGINGWYNNYVCTDISDEFQLKCNRYEDYSYLEKTLEKLQIHVDVKKIILISNCVPSDELYFGESPKNGDDLYPTCSLYKDTEQKIVTWVFGTYNKIVDTVVGNINYVNNGRFDRNPYYPKRIEINL
jgi:hypothetical protein